MIEIFINSSYIKDGSKLESYRWISPLVYFYVFDVGWALPTFAS
ncbi:hypothetical protein D1AOALGA4SA_7069 [Olavius algarvensis Delta 1 endosymbiont]|nr:hypothetical protein D1AOALGA4SA_7069 [Olavius algarvensis Delta 1 endosymbiont]